MNYWLFKSEPDEFSIDTLAKSIQQTTAWEGVRNYQARNMMRDQMQIGDQGFFYHSSCAEPGIVGIVEIISKAHPDLSALNSKSEYYDSSSTKENPRWYCVDVRLVEKFKRNITLEELKANAKLKELLILRKGNRLSITPISKPEWDAVIQML